VRSTWITNVARAVKTISVKDMGSEGQDEVSRVLPEIKEGECWFCTERCTEDDWCDGCECFICMSCYEVSAEDLSRWHDPEDHQPEDVGAMSMPY
jgi:hypothetical protein